MRLALQTPRDVGIGWARRLRAIRLSQGLKQQTLAAQAGVSVVSLRRFERSGDISLQNLLRLVHVLGRLSEFESLLAPPAARTMAELERLSAPQRLPQRGRR